MRDHSSYVPAVLKTCKELYNLKCQFIKKMKQNNNNKNFIIHTRSQKRKKYIGSMGEFLKSVQDELYLKSALGFIKD